MRVPIDKIDMRCAICDVRLSAEAPKREGRMFDVRRGPKAQRSLFLSHISTALILKHEHETYNLKPKSSNERDHD